MDISDEENESGKDVGANDTPEEEKESVIDDPANDNSEEEKQSGFFVPANDLARLITIMNDEKEDLDKNGKDLVEEHAYLVTKSRKRKSAQRHLSFAKRIGQRGQKDIMPDQSLVRFVVDGEDCDNLGLDKPSIDLDRILEQDSVHYDGITYKKNRCYKHKVDGDRVFGIKHFLREINTDSEPESCVSAYCVEIIPFNRTVLETVNPTSELKFIQRGGSEREIHLSEFEKEIQKSPPLPQFMYHERQSGSSHLLFGLEDASKAKQRNGPRDLKKSPLRGIDFYAGAGLMSNGFQAVGLNIVIAVEKNEDAIKSYGKIHGAKVSKVSEISSHECKQILSTREGKIAFHDTVETFLQRCAQDFSFKEALGTIDFVVTCSPCQGFSKQNVFKQGNVEQNNNESLRILNAAELLQPKLFVFENVLGMWEERNIKGYLQKMVNGLTFDFGYNVKVGKLCAADFGDPQLRPRLILIASLSHIGVPVFPNPTHSPSYLCNTVSGGLFPYVTAKDALIMEEKKYPESELLINDDGKVRDPNKPTTTVLASKSSAHYNLNRFYSLSENAILMGQSSDFVSKLVGTNKSKQRQIGNGVSMGMAQAIARSCFEVFRWCWKEAPKPRTTLVPKRSDEEELDWLVTTDDESNGEVDVKDLRKETSIEMKNKTDDKGPGEESPFVPGISHEVVIVEAGSKKSGEETSVNRMKSELDGKKPGKETSNMLVMSKNEEKVEAYSNQPDKKTSTLLERMSDEDVKYESGGSEPSKEIPSSSKMVDKSVKKEADRKTDLFNMSDKDVNSEADRKKISRERSILLATSNEDVAPRADLRRFLDIKDTHALLERSDNDVSPKAVGKVSGGKDRPVLLDVSEPSRERSILLHTSNEDVAPKAEICLPGSADNHGLLERSDNHISSKAVGKVSGGKDSPILLDVSKPSRETSILLDTSNEDVAQKAELWLPGSKDTHDLLEMSDNDVYPRAVGKVSGGKDSPILLDESDEELES